MKTTHQARLVTIHHPGGATDLAVLAQAASERLAAYLADMLNLDPDRAWRLYTSEGSWLGTTRSLESEQVPDGAHLTLTDTRPHHATRDTEDNDAAPVHEDDSALAHEDDADPATPSSATPVVEEGR